MPEITARGGTQLDDTTAKYWPPPTLPAAPSALGLHPETGLERYALRPADSAPAAAAPSILSPNPTGRPAPACPTIRPRHPRCLSLARPNHAGLNQVFVFGGLYLVGGTSGFRASMAGIVGAAQSLPDFQIHPVQAWIGQHQPHALPPGPIHQQRVSHDISAGDNAVRCALGSPIASRAWSVTAAGAGYDLAQRLGFHRRVQPGEPVDTGVARPPPSPPILPKRPLSRYRAPHRHRARPARRPRAHRNRLLPDA